MIGRDPDQPAFDAAVTEVDVLEVAGRIIGNPARSMVSLTAKVAMAHAIETFNAIAIEADLLVRAVDRAIECSKPSVDGPTEALAVEQLLAQADQVRALVAAARRGSGPSSSPDTPIERIDP